MTISSLQESKPGYTNNLVLTKTISTQTSDTGTSPILTHSPLVHMEFLLLKTRLDQIEQAVNKLPDNLTSQLNGIFTAPRTDQCQNQTSGNSRTSNNKLNSTSTTHMTDQGQTQTSGNIQTSKKLNSTFTTHMTNQGQTKPPKNSQNSNRDLNSISTTAMTDQCQTHTSEHSRNSNNKQTSNQKKNTKSPPVTAKKREENETYEEFFEKYLNHYQQIGGHFNKNYKASKLLKSSNLKVGEPPLAEETTREYFLGKPNKQTERWKQYPTRLITNSRLQQRRI